MKNKPNKQKEPVWETILRYVIGIVWLIMFGSIPWSIGNLLNESPEQHYTVPGQLISFQRLWEIEAYGAVGSSGNALVTLGEHVYFYGQLDPKEGHDSLVKLHLTTGKAANYITILQRTTTIAGSGHFIYAGRSSRGGSRQGFEPPEPAEVVGYDVEIDERVWIQKIHGAREINYLSPFGDAVAIVAANWDGGETYQSLRFNSGSVLYSNPVALPTIYMHNVWIMVEPPQMIRAVNGRTNTVVWDRNVAERLNKEGVYFAPLLDNGVIVGRTGRQNSGRVYALNSENGHILWASEERVLGNIVANRGVTFYVTEQAVLRAVNSRTGEIIASLAFIPEIASDEAMDTHYAYNIAINDDIVLMYMGNSKQLFAFRFVR